MCNPPIKHKSTALGYAVTRQEVGGLDLTIHQCRCVASVGSFNKPYEVRPFFPGGADDKGAEMVKDRATQELMRWCQKWRDNHGYPADLKNMNMAIVLAQKIMLYGVGRIHVPTQMAIAKEIVTMAEECGQIALDGCDRITAEMIIERIAGNVSMAHEAVA